MPADEQKMEKAMEAAKAAPRRPSPRDASPPPPTRLRVPPPIEDDFGTVTVDVDGEQVEQKVRVAMTTGLLGTGQGGARIAQAFWNLGYRHVGAFNTTETDFKGIAADMPKFSMDIGGAGKDMRMALEALSRREEEAYELMTRAWGDRLDCALICVGLGGGTGSGTGARLVELARRYMEDKNRPPRVGAVVSLPTAEGQMVARNAVTAFRDLVAVKASPLIIMDNARIDELYNDEGVAKLFPLANDAVARMFHLFNLRAAEHSEHITFDRSEFAQLLDGGIVVMGEADIDVKAITSPADVSQAIRERLARNVLASVDLTRGKKAACVFTGEKAVLDSFPTAYFEAGFNQLDRVVGSARKDGAPTVIHRGLYEGTERGLQCYTMISELPPPHDRLADLARKGGLDRNAPGLAQFLGL